MNYEAVIGACIESLTKDGLLPLCPALSAGEAGVVKGARPPYCRAEACPCVR